MTPDELKELQELRNERDAMLEDLDNLCGWPCRLVDLPKEYAALARFAQMRTDALKVLLLTPHIRAYLSAFDEKALAQACAAIPIELPPALVTSELRFELEELMGGGKWEAVWETKEQADYESPDRLSFNTEGEAAAYAKRHWRDPAHVRIVTVRTIRTVKG